MQRKNYHILGVSGIGMSAVARLLSQMGHYVSGHDKNITALTEQLEVEGIEIKDFFSESTDCLIYSSAIKSDHPEIIKAKKLNIKLFHRSNILAEIMDSKETILVTGTHGKTTVSALLTHALIHSKLDPSFAIGGILKNYLTNAKLNIGKFFVAEADESDGSFLNFPCDFAIVTNLDNDHLDYWKTDAMLHNAFQKFFKKVKRKLIWNYDDENLRRLNPKGLNYGFHPKAGIKIYNYQTIRNGSVFSIRFLDKDYKNIFIPFFGKHQVLNVTALIAFFLLNDLSLENLFESLLHFKGLNRRDDLIGAHDNVEIYHDYAHHPTEVFATLDSFRKKIEEKRLVVIFQPHRYSRINKLMYQFEKCFQNADLLFITDIYSANEQPIDKCLENFFQAIDHSKKQLLSHENFYKILLEKVNIHDCVLFLGAGDINQKASYFFQKLKKIKLKLKIAVLYGGEAFEHEISIRSARFFLENLDKSIYDIEPVFIDQSFKLDLKLLSKILACDVCLPILHGKKGEGGLIQAVLEGFKIPFSGCNYLSSSICMNKGWSKSICLNEKIKTANFLHITHRKWKNEKENILNFVKKNFQGPVFIKGCHMGSTIGMKRTENLVLIEKDIEDIFLYDDEIILEDEVIGRQIEFAVLGTEFILVGEPCEIKMLGIYTYEKKYEDDLVKIPVANIDQSKLEEGKKLAIKVYQALSCRGFARVDFFLDEENNFIFNEINPVPGFTEKSAYYPMLKYLKITKKEFINRLIILALHAHRTYDNHKIKS
jgi:D-alanine-D-alanine ligase/UDP-N-acetylmuramate--alanine ligase